LKIGNDLVNPEHITKVTRHGNRVVLHLSSKGGPNANLLIVDDKPGEKVWIYLSKLAEELVGEGEAHAVHEGV